MFATLLSALLALAAPQAPAQNTLTIEGRVLRAGTMDPIANVQITISKANSTGPNLNAEASAALDSLQSLIAANPGLPQTTLDSLVTSREQALGLAAGTLAPGAQTTALTDATGHFSFANQAP